MSGNNVLHWPDSLGWLVLSGGATTEGEVRSIALSRALLEGEAVYIALDADSDEAVLEDMADLGAMTGYLVNVLAEDDDTIRARIKDAAIVVIPGHYSSEALHTALIGAPLDGIRDAFEHGAVILAEGSGAALFGSHFGRESGQLAEGFHWLENAFIAPAITSIAQADAARAVLEANSARIAIGIGVGSALALGPNSEVETWGRGQVTIALGKTGVE